MKINKFNQLNEYNEVPYNVSLGYDMPMIDYLSKLYQLWTEAEGLPPLSADDLWSEAELTKEQHKFLEKFLELWDLTEGIEQDYHDNGYALIKTTNKFNV